MKYKLKFFCLILCFSSWNHISALTLADLFPTLDEQQIARLKQEGVLRSNDAMPEELPYLPRIEPFLSMQKKLSEKNPKSNLEAVYYVRNLPAAPVLKLQNSFLKVSTLTGLEFYSRSEKAVKTLIYELYAIDEKTSEKIPDLSISKPTPEISFPIFQDDETFGKVHYQMTMRYHAGPVLSVHIENIQPLKKGIFTMAKERESELYMSIIPVGNDLVIYALSSIRQAPPSFVKKNADESLFNRMDAYKNWTVSRFKAARAG